MDFCVYEDKLFLFYEDRVECMDLRTGKLSLLCEEGIEAGNYACYQGKLYFIGESYSLYAYYIGEDRLEAFSGIKAVCFLVTPKGIFYANANDGWRLYCMDFDGGERQRISDAAVKDMDFFGELLYYVPQEGGYVNFMNLDGGAAGILLELPEAFALFVAEEEQMLYIFYENAEEGIAVYPYNLS